jgi:deoxyadenosine/deoxycytidine kinase
MYKLILDNGKPYEIEIKNKKELVKELTSFYYDNYENNDYYEVFVYNKDNKEITNNKFIIKIINKIID